LSRDETIFRKGQRAKHFYQVVSGCVRTYAKLGDGRRFIYAFYFPVDCFGLEILTKHSFSAETIVPSIIRVIRKSEVATRASTNAAIAKQMLDITNLELQRAQNHGVLLRSRADERVANFLFAMKKRHRQKELELVITRQDIADYLNLTLETVSRALTRLKKRSVISIINRRQIAVRLRKPLVA
jgi:CRP/FNR family nitrogen fixation transcriptional regulator